MMNQTWKDRCKKLLSDGYKIIGKGDTSVVLHKQGESNVVKFSTCRDIETPKFVEIIKSSRNEHFPKISDIEVYNGGYFWYVIEKLSHNKTEELSAFMNDYLQTKAVKKGGFEEADNWKAFNYKNRRSLIDSFNRRFPTFSRAMDIVIEHTRPGYLDFHDENIMFRGNTPVIVDPWKKPI